jgi:metallo-beta-lactamase family protein
LFTTKDAEKALSQVQHKQWDEAWQIGDVQATLVPVGHLLGASGVRLSHDDKSVFFSGDLGRTSDPLMHPPRPFQGADTLVIESTYGDRLHEEEDQLQVLEHVVNRVCGRGGVLMIPAFAVGRSQTILHLLATLHSQGRIADVPVFLNSPMAIRATEIFLRHPEAHRLTPAQCDAMWDDSTYVRTAEQSKALNEQSGPMILIAGSGMATGGRILHHLKSFGPNPANGLLLVGYQAGGTRGRDIADGEESVKIHGQYVPIRAERFSMHSLSGHADWRETVSWLSEAPAPKRVLINHGEPAASDKLRKHLAEELGWESEVAEFQRTYEL